MIRIEIIEVMCAVRRRLAYAVDLLDAALALMRDDIASPYISAKLRADVIARDGGVCVYCRRKPAELHIDHVIPRCRGGRNTLRNLVTSCYECNIRKGARTPEEWLQ